MKKLRVTKLVLARSTVRVLSSPLLAHVAAGNAMYTNSDCIIENNSNRGLCCSRLASGCGSEAG